MVKNPKLKKQSIKLEGLIKGNSARELTFSYVFECLCEVTASQGFLGFTLNPGYAEQIKSQPAELLKLRDYFDEEVLKSILIYLVYQQKELFLRWTNKNEMERYLKLNGLNANK